MARELNPDERADIVERLVRHGLLDAVVRFRQATGASLAEAVEAVRALGRDAGLLNEAPSGQGLSADVLVIGPFRTELLPFLEYSAERYAGIAQGTTVVQRLVDVYESTPDVFALAACFGIDPFDFNAHALDASCADLGALRAFDSDELVARLVALREAGFRFYFYLHGLEIVDDASADPGP